MTTKQMREMDRQATVTQTRVQRFIELQTQVNHFIDTHSGPDEQLIKMTDELESLGDSLNNDEIHQVVEWYNSQQQKADDSEDIEWMIG